MNGNQKFLYKWIKQFTCKWNSRVTADVWRFRLWTAALNTSFSYLYRGLGELVKRVKNKRKINLYKSGIFNDSNWTICSETWKKFLKLIISLHQVFCTRNWFFMTLSRHGKCLSNISKIIFKYFCIYNLSLNVFIWFCDRKLLPIICLLQF